MSQAIKNPLTAKLISVGLGVVTVFLWTAGTDPVNATKLFMLGLFSCAAVATILQKGAWKALFSFPLALLSLATFNLLTFATLLTSSAPFSQSFYGVYGRNNGVLLYFFLALTMIVTLSFTKTLHFKYIVYALTFSGLVNLLYGIWVLLFGDFIGWTNPYGNLLGTLGNPNFAGSFFGMFSIVPLVGVFARNTPIKIRAASAALLVLVLICVEETQAVQGKVLLVASFAIVIFFKLRELSRAKIWLAIYVACGSLIGCAAVLGALQIGPLTKLIYKNSVSLRGEYWYAGWVTGSKNPFTGVGFDSYGDWYRRSRRESALEVPGVDTVTNTAHNVFMDLFSFGGWPVLITYVMLVAITIVSIIRFVMSQTKLDPIFVILVSAWTCYQLQSIISINQVGLAIWGWTLGGAIIAYSHNLKKQDNFESPSKARQKRTIDSSPISQGLLAFLGGGLGVLIACPPLTADIMWKQALDSQQVEKVEKTFVSGYFNPKSTFKFNSAVALFETSNLPDYAYKYAIEGIKFNPDSFDSWRNLYQIKGSSDEEKKVALKNMIRLDPLNPNFRSD